MLNFLSLVRNYLVNYYFESIPLLRMSPVIIVVIVFWIYT